MRRDDPLADPGVWKDSVRVAQTHIARLIDEHPAARLERAAADRGDAGRTWERLALLGVLVLALGLRLPLLGARPLWIDEAYSLGVASKPFHEILAFLRTSDAHPIGYYALLSLWIRWFGTGLVAMRSLSLLCGTVAVLLTWRLGRQMCSPLVGIVAAALVALNPFQIIASNEMRMYPLLECLALASTWILWRAAHSVRLLGWWIGYGVSLALMAYTSYYSFFLIPAQVLWVLLSRSSRHLVVNLSLAGAAALVLYAPWIPYALALSDRGVPWRQPLHLDYLLSVAATQTFGGYLFNSGSYYTVGSGLPPEYDLLLLLPFLVLVGTGVVALGLNGPARLLVGLSWAGPLLLISLASVARGGVVAYPRHLVFLEPFAAVLIAAGIVHLRTVTTDAPRVALPLLGSLLIAAFGYPAVAQANPAYQYYRYDLAAEFVRTRYIPSDAIVYFPAGTDLPFRYYFPPPGEQIVILADRRHWSREALHSSIQQTADLVATHGFDRVWLVYSLPWPRGSLSDLVQALNERSYRESPPQDFRSLWVMLFTRAPGSSPGESRPSVDGEPSVHVVGP